MRHWIKQFIETIRLSKLDEPIVLYIFVLLSITQFFFKLTSVYTFRTPSYIQYDWELLQEPISILYFPVFLFAMYELIYRPTKIYLSMFTFFLMILFTQLVYYFFDSFLFVNMQFEMLFASFGAICIAGTLYSKLRSSRSLLAFFQMLVLIHMYGILISALVGVEDITGRINAQNLDYGTTGLLIGVYCVYLWFVEKRLSIFAIIFPIVPLLLTGSRSHLFLTLTFFFYAVIRSINLKKYLIGTKKRIRLIATSTAILLIILLFVIIRSGVISSITNESILRVTRIQNIEDVKSDRSVIGRLKSILTGIEVLSNRPLGVTFSFIDLQRHMNMRGYPTFPHQNFLANYLVLGPIFIIIIYFLLRIMRRLQKKRQPYRFIYYYLFIYSLLAGGCPHKLKVIFIYIFVFLIGAVISKEQG